MLQTVMSYDVEKTRAEKLTTPRLQPSFLATSQNRILFQPKLSSGCTEKKVNKATILKAELPVKMHPGSQIALWRNGT